MAMSNPKGRVNYEPNSWEAEVVRANRRKEVFARSRCRGRRPKLRMRSETFADHYSQARQFYISQTEIEQNHIVDAFIFELSKVKSPRSASAWWRSCSTSMRIWQESCRGSWPHGIACGGRSCNADPEGPKAFPRP